MKKVMSTILMLTAMLAAGCSDGAVAPQSASNRQLGPEQGSSATLSATPATYQFTIDPTRTVTIPLGKGNSIVFPKGSLCSQASPYGADYWEDQASCYPTSSAITVHVTAKLDNGHARFDFDQHIRFSPANPVILTLSDNQAATNLAFNINYCQSITSTCTDESKSDLLVATAHNSVNGTLVRRILHFSGYSITTGGDDGSGGSQGSFNKVKTGSTIN